MTLLETANNYLRKKEQYNTEIKLAENHFHNIFKPTTNNVLKEIKQEFLLDFPVVKLNVHYGNFHRYRETNITEYIFIQLRIAKKYSIFINKYDINEKFTFKLFDINPPLYKYHEHIFSIFDEQWVIQHVFESVIKERLK